VRNSAYAGGAYGDGIHDDTAAIQACIDSYTTGYGTVWFPDGVYLVTSTITISQHRIHLLGSGRFSTQIKFMPTENDTCFLCSLESGVLYQGSIIGMSLYSTDTSYVKVAINLQDCSQYALGNLTISNYWTDTSHQSVGLKINGRELLCCGSGEGSVRINADRPLVIGNNPAAGGWSGGARVADPGRGVHCDHMHFQNLYLTSWAGGKIVEIETDTVVTNLLFDGHQAWVSGAYGLYWRDDTVYDASYNLSLNNIRTESVAATVSWVTSTSYVVGDKRLGKAAGAFVTATYLCIAGHTSGASTEPGVGADWETVWAPTYSIFIDKHLSNNLRVLSITNCKLNYGTNGIFLRSTDRVALTSVMYDGASPKIGLNADLTVYGLSLRNCWWADNNLWSLTDQKRLWSIPQRNAGHDAYEMAEFESTSVDDDLPLTSESPIECFSMTTGSLVAKRPVATAISGASATLTEANYPSGSVISCTAATVAITLPALTAGLHYTR
jgi:hypothetical protein